MRYDEVMSGDRGGPHCERGHWQVASAVKNLVQTKVQMPDLFGKARKLNFNPRPAGVLRADLQELSEKEQTLDDAVYYTYRRL